MAKGAQKRREPLECGSSLVIRGGPLAKRLATRSPGLYDGAMKSQLTATRIVSIIFAVLVATAVANYDRLLPHRWHTYRAPDGKFSIELPAEPATETVQVPIENGGTKPMIIVSAETSKSTEYTCSYIEDETVQSESPDQALDSARDGSLKKTQGTLISQERLALAGFPALDMKAHTRGDSLLDARMLIAGKRLYMIVAVTTVESDREPRTIQRVFDSFRVLDR